MSSYQEKPTSLEERMLILKSYDWEEFAIKESAALMSVTIKNLVDQGCVVIPLLKLGSKTLSQVTQYLNEKIEISDEDEEQKKKAFDDEFIQGISSSSYDEMIDLISAADDLEIKDLLDLLCAKTAKHIKDKNAAIRKGNAWATFQ